MRVVILSARTGWHTDELCRALSVRGHTACVLPYEALTTRIAAECSVSSEGVPLLEGDAVLARIIPNGSLDQIIFRVDLLHWLEQRGLVVMNSARAIERSVNKFLTTALLHDAGLPTPNTVVCERASEAMDAIVAMGDVVVKPLFGSMGHGLVRVSDPDVGFRVVRSLEQIRAVFYVQQAINHDGRDIRAFVIGGRVLAAIERTATRGDWRTNVSRGGAARPCTLPPAWGELAIGAAAAVGADYAGVDLLPSTDGNVFVLEVNGIPGWEGLQRATGLDVAGAIVDHLASRVAVNVAREAPAGQEAR